MITMSDADLKTIFLAKYPTAGFGVSSLSAFIEGYRLAEAEANRKKETKPLVQHLSANDANGNPVELSIEFPPEIVDILTRHRDDDYETDYEDNEFIKLANQTQDHDIEPYFEQIKRLLDDMGLAEYANIKPLDRFADELGFDSLDAVEFLMAIEKLFKISIPDEDAEKCISILDTVRYLKARKNNTSLRCYY